ncbi:MAG: ABC transporter substrate-binding protein, partial [Planctomycetota bacterium]
MTTGTFAATVRGLALVLVLASLATCTNNPYRAGESGRNYYYSTFGQPPKHLDPAVSYSSNQYTFLMQIYEPPLDYHYLKRPYELIPLTATDIPSPVYHDAEGRVLEGDPPADKVARAVYTVSIRDGIRYQDLPCFAKDGDGKPLYLGLTEADMADIDDVGDFPVKDTRTLTAADYVYQFKRLAHPKLDCPILSTMEDYVLGLDDLAQALDDELERARALRRKEAGALYNQETDERANPIWIDLDKHACPGIRVVDEHTYEVTLKKKYPQLLLWLTMPFFCPIPREADRFFEQAPLVTRNLSLDNRPIGTGPYRMETYLENMEIVLTRNENYRETFYPKEGEPSDRENGLLDDAGKPIPFIEKAVYKLEKEAIPRWNKFLQGYYDASAIASDVFDQAIQMGDEGLDLSDRMQRRGIRLVKSVATSTSYYAFNMHDDVVGGYAPEKQKLRQAISIALSTEEYIQIFLNGRGIAAQDLIPPGIFGHQSGPEGINTHVYRWDAEENRPVRRSIDEARKLLAEAGYPGGKDANGKPLVISFDTSWTGAAAKPQLDWLRKQFNKINIDLQFRQTDYNRFQDKVSQGNWQFLRWGWNADYPDPENFLFLLYGPNGKVKHAGENAANYENPEFDRLFKQVESMENGPERMRIIKEMIDVARTDAPWIWGLHWIDFGL